MSCTKCKKEPEYQKVLEEAKKYAKENQINVTIFKENGKFKFEPYDENRIYICEHVSPFH